MVSPPLVPLDIEVDGTGALEAFGPLDRCVEPAAESVEECVYFALKSGGLIRLVGRLPDVPAAHQIAPLLLAAAAIVRPARRVSARAIARQAQGRAAFGTTVNCFGRGRSGKRRIGGCSDAASVVFMANLSGSPADFA
jgi:hypothetical protein